MAWNSSTNNKFRILFQDENLVVIDKPPGFHVHPPETKAEKVPRHKIILHQLRDQVGARVYPIHRLDVGTSGVLVFALNSETAGWFGKKLQERSLEKKYWAVVRGYLPDEGEIDIDLESDSSGEMVPALTTFKTLKRLELPQAVGKRHSQARYSWLEVFPKTGRFHQIRRHMNRISHPVIGDAAHGDSHHNRFFRETLGIRGLCLRAMELRLPSDGGRQNLDGKDASQAWDAELEIKKEPRLFAAGSFFQWDQIQKLFQDTSL